MIPPPRRCGCSRRPDCSAWESTVATPSCTERTVPLTTISSPSKPIPRNCTDSRFRCSGPPAASVWARASQGHRPEPVQDAARQPHPLGELLVDVDRVEVTRGAGVADGDVRIRRHLQFDRVARREASRLGTPDELTPDAGAHGLAALVARIGLEHVRTPSRARSSISLTVVVVVISSPATTRGPHSNSWPA